MNKRIISLLLCFVMVFSMLATAVPTFAENKVQLTVTSDKATVYAGETVNFSVSIGAVNNLGVLEFELLIPDDLTIVDSSISVPDGIESIMDSDGDIVVPNTMNDYVWSYSAKNVGYTSTASLEILTFQCTVNTNATLGAKMIEIYVWDSADNDMNDLLVATSVNPAAVTVTPKPVAVTGVTLNKTMLSLNLNGFETLIATVQPSAATNQKLTWSSSKDAVATVDQTGKVTAVAEGTATITVTTEDGSFKAICEVTVSCSHANKTPVAAKDSDCKNQGWDAYVKCDDCGQLLAENGTTEIAEIPFRALDYTKHTGGTATCTAKAVCTVCSQPYGNFASHQFTVTDTKDQTTLKTPGNCTTEAEYYYTCSACGQSAKGIDEAKWYKADKVADNHASSATKWNTTATTHQKVHECCGAPYQGANAVPHDNWNDGICLTCGYGCLHTSKTPHAAVAATCQAGGNEAYSVCNACGQMFNAAGEKISAVPATGVNENNHTGTPINGGTEDVHTKYSCCGATASAQHDAKTTAASVVKIPATCMVMGTTEYTCSCGYKWTEQDVAVDSNNHKAKTELKQYTDSGKEYHYNECEYGCTTKLNKTECSGGTATCVSKATCTTCGKAYGSEDTVNGHNWASSWSNDSSNGTHYKACLNTGCTARNEVDTHSSTGGNVATCVKAAKCDICSVSYGTVDTVNGHKPSASWVNTDASGHWHVCENAGCGEKLSFAAHKDNAHPDGAASEDYAVICSTCGYQIHAMLNHTCVTFNAVVDPMYLKSAATCVSPAVYYKSCVKCGTAGTETFTSGTADTVNGHNWASAWSSDADGHWHACGNGCGTELDAASHGEPVWKYNASTNKHWSECPTCGYKLTAEAAHVDADNNGVCDTCGGTVRKPGSGGSGHYFHFDYNGDGKCDYCNTCVTHVDKNGDGKCDHCFVESSKTFDAGIALYAGMAVLAATGSAVVIGKKRKEQE